jgi:hypothetical protein
MRFHESAAPFNEPLFYRRLNDAISLIKQSSSLEAKAVMEAIIDHRVSLSSFFSVTDTHYSQIREMYNHTHQDRLPASYPPSDLAIRKIESMLNGIIFDGETIYLDSQLKPKTLARIIMHEVFHHIHTGLVVREAEIFSEKTAYYRDEIRAHRAEQCLFPKKITRSVIGELHDRVQTCYSELLEDGETPFGYVDDVLDTCEYQFHVAKDEGCQREEQEGEQNEIASVDVCCDETPSLTQLLKKMFQQNERINLPALLLIGLALSITCKCLELPPQQGFFTGLILGLAFCQAQGRLFSLSDLENLLPTLQQNEHILMQLGN